MTVRLFSSEDEIHRVGLGLLDLTLPKPEWTHSAHFAAVIWLLRYRPELDAARCMPDFIRAYNVATGVANTDTGGYHETITQASCRAARTVLACQGATMPVFVIVNDLMNTALGRSDWLLEYWSRERLFSPEARKHWCEPDLRIFPY